MYRVRRFLQRRAILIMYAAVSLGCSACRDGRSDSSPMDPPDLTVCSQIEIEYIPSTLESLFRSRRGRAVLSPDEIEYLESLQRFTLEEREDIEALAGIIARGTYVDTRQSVPAVVPWARIICTNGDEAAPVVLQVADDFIITEDRRYFRLHRHGWVLQFTPQVLPFTKRQSCTFNLGATAGRIRRAQETFVDIHEWWCDVIVVAAAGYNEEVVKLTERQLRCPGAGQGKCNYALNAAWTADSPPDVVFLFDAKPGWNQHGGPELFTFDNHDPKGGLVLLNDGTLKFIRTQEELKQLRWK